MEHFDYLLNSETGEVMSLVDSGITLREKKPKNAVKYYMHGKNALGGGDAFVWNMYQLSTLSYDALSSSDVTRLMYLSTYIGYDGLIRANPRWLVTKEGLAELLSLSKKEVKRFWINTTNAGILSETEDGFIQMNENFFKKGRLGARFIGRAAGDGLYITKLYINSIQALYKQAEPSSHKSLSAVFQLLPFVNRQFNVVCGNPLATDSDEVVPITVEDCCEILGYSKESVRYFARKLMEPRFTVDGKSMRAVRLVLTRDTVIGHASIFINPAIYYAGTKDEQMQVLHIFNKNDQEAATKRMESAKFLQMLESMKCTDSISNSGRGGELHKGDE